MDPSKPTLRSRIWEMEPYSLLPLGTTHSERSIRVTVGRLKPYDPARHYSVKKHPEGVTVVRLA